MEGGVCAVSGGWSGRGWSVAVSGGWSVCGEWRVYLFGCTFTCGCVKVGLWTY